MKIGIFDPYLDTLSGGEKYMLSIASCLAKDHEVFIFWNKEKEAELRGVAGKKLGMDISPIFFYKNIFARNESWISRFIESRKFDAIIYLSDGSIPFVGTKLFIHFQFPIEWVNGDALKTRFKLAFVKDVFCNSYFTKHFVDRKLNVDSKILYPPVVTNRNEKIKKEDIILHVGRFDVDKNKSNYKKQDVMINVFKKMIDRNLKDWKFTMIIGTKNEDKDNVNKLKKTIEGYPIEILENPSNETLWENYSRAKIYWHATGYGEDLRKYPEKAEHFGISTVEAMGSGAVPIVINAGGQREIIENGKNGYLWDTLEELSDRTMSLIKNEKLLEEISIKAIERARIFGKDNFCESLRNIIK